MRRGAHGVVVYYAREIFGPHPFWGWSRPLFFKVITPKFQSPRPLNSAIIGGLLFLNGITGFRAYKKSILDVLETGLYLNLQAFGLFSLYDFKTDITKQTAVAYISTIIAFILLVGVIIHHVYLLVKIRKDQPPGRGGE